MKALFIRHAVAVERTDWLKDDLERPLSDRGIIVAKKVFKQLSKVYDAPEVIFCSNAKRAVETAQLFAQNYPNLKIEKTPLLNPGSSLEKLKELLKDKKVGYFAYVGHEPDMSEIVGEIISADGSAAVEIKKAALLEIEMDDDLSGVLRALIPPRIFG